MIIGHLNPYRVKWDLFVILCAIYNSIVLPLQIGFSPAFLKSNFIGKLDLVIDVCFLADIILTFRTTYTNLMTNE